MTPLSAQAEAFLAHQQRVAAVSDEPWLRALFDRAGIPLTSPLIDFQARYGGLVLLNGLVPMYWGLVDLLPRGDRPPLMPTARRFDDLVLINCCSTPVQINFELDLDGGYYEDGERVAANFDVYFEEIAERAGLQASE